MSPAAKRVHVMAEAEEENSIVFSTLERELNALVPTQRLWSRINETIEVEKSRMPVWQKLLVYVTNEPRESIARVAAAGIVLDAWNVRTGHWTFEIEMMPNRASRRIELPVQRASLLRIRRFRSIRRRRTHNSEPDNGGEHGSQRLEPEIR